MDEAKGLETKFSVSSRRLIQLVVREAYSYRQFAILQLARKATDRDTAVRDNEMF
jgi:hypothetical protein